MLCFSQFICIFKAKASFIEYTFNLIIFFSLSLVLAILASHRFRAHHFILLALEIVFLLLCFPLGTLHVMQISIPFRSLLCHIYGVGLILAHIAHTEPRQKKAGKKNQILFSSISIVFALLRFSIVFLFVSSICCCCCCSHSTSSKNWETQLHRNIAKSIQSAEAWCYCRRHLRTARNT